MKSPSAGVVSVVSAEIFMSLIHYHPQARLIDFTENRLLNLLPLAHSAL
jgi:hypothetical protein